MATSFTTLVRPSLCYSFAPPSFSKCSWIPTSCGSTSLQKRTIAAVKGSGYDAAGFLTDGRRGRVDIHSGSQPLVGSGRDCGGEGTGGEEGSESWSRRGLLGASSLVVAAGFISFSCDPAQAFSLGISGPKEWLRAQKRKTAQFLLNPIKASRNRLTSAVLLLSSAEGSSFENYEEAGRLVKVAARDCTPAELGSIIDFQTRTGVEVCTFKLILKNAASLLENDDPVKLQAVAALDSLIRSFIAVDGLLTRGGASAATQREDVMGALEQTMQALDRFQLGVQSCLDA